MQVLLLALLALLAAATAAAQTSADDFRLNQIQVLGSHNSYKKAMDPSLMEMLKAENPRYSSLEYEHVTLGEQLDLGLRKLELDVVYDPDGGRFAEPHGLTLIDDPAPYDPDGLMRQPGFKVLHVPDLDFRSNMYTFKQALEEMKAWSDRNPRHLPVLITMNAKTGRAAPGPEFVEALPFDARAYDEWDAEIRAVMPPDQLLTPDFVRGDFASLEAAVRAHAWPTLGESRGKFLFILDETGAKLETYVRGHPSLVGRVMFVNAHEGRPEAAVRIVNDSIRDFHYIQQLVREGYVVRTRADANTQEARTGDYSRMKAAFRSGAQYVSTDYYYPNEDFGSGYQVGMPGGGPGRWNPLLAPPLEDLPELE